MSRLTHAFRWATICLCLAGCGDSTAPLAATKVAFSMQPSASTAGAPMTIVVEIQDATGARVTSSNASVTLALADNPGAATLLGNATAGTINGLATFTNMRIERAADGYTIVATSSGLTSATSNAFAVNPGTATKIGFLTQPASATAGAPLVPGVRVAVMDALENVVPTGTGQIVIAIAYNAGAGVLSGTTAASPTNGIVTYTDLSIDRVGTGYTLYVNHESLGSALSDAFNIGAGAPAQLRVVDLPAQHTSMNGIGHPIHVLVTDAQDNPIGTATNAVSLSIGSNPGGGTLAGVLTRSALNGIATFTDVSIDKAGQGYTLIASSPGLANGTSSPFTIVHGEPASIVFLEQPATNTPAGLVLPDFRVAVRDAGGNAITDRIIQVQIGKVSGPLSGAVSTLVLNAQHPLTVEGVATFSSLKINHPGTYVLRAFTPSFFVDSDPITVPLDFQKVTVGGGPTSSFPITEERHACSLSTAGVAHCWGRSLWGAMGVQTSDATAYVLQPELVGTSQLFTDIDTGNIHTCAVTTDGEAYCWGSNVDGRLGNGDEAGGTQATPVPVSGGLHFVSISAGDTHTCGVTSTSAGATSGPAYCWGNNDAGQLGDGTTDNRDTPTAVAGGLTFTAITASHGKHTCGITVDFLAYCWGLNDHGQLGDNTTDPRHEPTLVDAAATHLFRQISVGQNHTCASRADDSTYCWGANSNQQIGDGNTANTDRLTPSQVTQSFTASSGGWSHSCGISGGIGSCWGANGSGQLGDGGTTERNAPAAVAGALSFSQLSAGQDFTCGVTTDHRVFCWGSNLDGQLGDGTFSQRLSPSRVFP